MNERAFSITGEELVKPKDGEPCGHTGCANHLLHPCEGCGRIGMRVDGELEATFSQCFQEAFKYQSDEEAENIMVYGNGLDNRRR